MSQFTNYEPIKKGPVAEIGGYKYLDDKLGWVYVSTGPNRNFYEIDDVKQGRIPKEEKRLRSKKSRKPMSGKPRAEVRQVDVKTFEIHIGGRVIGTAKSDYDARFTMNFLNAWAVAKA